VPLQQVFIRKSRWKSKIDLCQAIVNRTATCSTPGDHLLRLLVGVWVQLPFLMNFLGQVCQACQFPTTLASLSSCEKSSWLRNLNENEMQAKSEPLVAFKRLQFPIYRGGGVTQCMKLRCFLFVLLTLFIYVFSVAIVGNYRRFLDSSFLSQLTARLEFQCFALYIF
jgi:hypothetical protein